MRTPVEQAIGITVTEQRAIDEAADWYVDALTKLGVQASLNAAFENATARAVQGLNEHLHKRLALAFTGAMVTEPARYRWLRERAAERVAARVDAAAKRTPTVAASLGNKGWHKPGDETLAGYLRILESSLQAAREESGALRTLDGAPIDQGQKFARQLWAIMRNARIFDFSPSDFTTIWEAADHYTTTKIAKQNWIDMGNGKLPSKEDSDQYTDRIDEAGSRVPFPDPLPFDACYFGLGHGVALAEYQWKSRAQDMNDREVIAAAILGYVMWTGPSGGWAVEILQVVEPEDNYILPNVVCMNGIWHNPVLNMAPWLTTHLVAVVNDHRQLVVETRLTNNQRHDWGKKSKRLKVPGLIPKPYYTVRMTKKLIEDSGARSREALAQISRELAYRHDRRGHERCYIRRGRLPLSAKDAQKLQEAEYQVWTIDEPTSNAYRQLMERGQPPKAPDEWIAILTRWIDPTVVGDESKPYIPAIRLPAVSEAQPQSASAVGAPRES